MNIELQLKIKDAVFLLSLVEARELYEELGKFCNSNKPNPYTGIRGDAKSTSIMWPENKNDTI